MIKSIIESTTKKKRWGSNFFYQNFNLKGGQFVRNS